MSRTIRKSEIYLEYQPYFDYPMHARRQLFNQATSNDAVTVDTWRETWLRQIRANRDKFGPFKDKGVGKLHGIMRGKPCILAGSGPSLAINGDELRNKKDIPIVSCLHNFHYFEDRDIPVDFYVSLDAGEVTVEEVSEGGAHGAEHYWNRTKDRTLLAYIGTHPELLEKWQGEIYFFTCPIPDTPLSGEIEKIEKFRTAICTGGNVLGACTYLAKAIFGANPLIWVGADFSFSYSDKFHGWDSKYDRDIGHYIRMTDVFGNKVKTWQSYANFKGWFDHVVMTVPGIYINASEGGCFGSYPEGNIRQLMQMQLKDALGMFNLCDEIEETCTNPETEKPRILFT